MGFYSRYIFPYILEWAMSDSELDEERTQTLSGTHGEVLEIGFGTGRNLSFYPPEVSRLTAIDSNPAMNRMARRRMEKSSLSVDLQTLNGELLPLDAGRFDCVVSSWTLCSIARVELALAEIVRVLKPDGSFHFVEHGLSPEPSVAAWQRRLNPLQKRIGDGCHLNRDMRQLVGEAGLEIVQLDNHYLPRSPRILGYLYRGVANK